MNGAADAAGAALLEYYRRRAPEYDAIYAKPERQADLARLEELVRDGLRGRRVLELACGTGWWTRVAAESARSVTATDASDEVLALARGRAYTSPVEFAVADALAPEAVPGDFDAILAAFWVSHLPRRAVAEWVDGLERRLPAGGRIVLLDNRWVPGSSTPISRRDDAGDTWQLRRLASGEVVEVRKNFPTADDLRGLAGGPGRTGEVVELDHFWLLSLDTGPRG